ncbi:MAG: RNA polymerase sigma factor [Fimbriimonas ginsengisoli]|nr:RNA polymerase sigma factor [Fimbriimonas ginsengisoli]
MANQALDICQIARDHYDAVYRFCARRIGVEHAADLAQETFLTAQRALGRYEGRSELKIWLFGIAHNECRRMARDRRLKPTPMQLDEAPDGQDAEQTLIDREALRCALDRLSPEHRQVVLLREVEGLSYEEAGKVLGIPEGTVKSRLHHAFLLLRKSLSDLPPTTVREETRR